MAVRGSVSLPSRRVDALRCPRCNSANQRLRCGTQEVSHGDGGNYWGLAGTFLSICKQNPVLLRGFHLFITVSLCQRRISENNVTLGGCRKTNGGRLQTYLQYFCVKQK